MGAKNGKVPFKLFCFNNFGVYLFSIPQAFYRVEILIHSHEIEGGYVRVQMGLLNDFNPIMYNSYCWHLSDCTQWQNSLKRGWGFKNCAHLSAIHASFNISIEEVLHTRVPRLDTFHPTFLTEIFFNLISNLFLNNNFLLL